MPVAQSCGKSNYVTTPRHLYDVDAARRYALRRPVTLGNVRNLRCLMVGDSYGDFAHRLMWCALARMSRRAMRFSHTRRNNKLFVVR
jgi:hypothetical protein